MTGQYLPVLAPRNSPKSRRSIWHAQYGSPAPTGWTSRQLCAQVAAAFERIKSERGRLDVLLNNAWGGYENMVEDGKFTWSQPFWLQPRWRWDAMMTVGVRGAFVAAQFAARAMVAAHSGLIVNISFWAAQKHLGNVLYGCAKAATDELTADMAHELAPHGISVVSLYPGLVRTEAVMDGRGRLPQPHQLREP